MPPTGIPNKAPAAAGTTAPTVKRRARKSRARAAAGRTVPTGGGTGAQMALGDYDFTPEEGRMVSALGRETQGINSAIDNAVTLICQAHSLPGKWTLKPDYSGIRPYRPR